eukprot:jgi/Picre1/27888/NNA_000851.t1
MSDYEYDQESLDEGLDNPDVVTKYKAAAKIVNNAIAAVVEKCKAGAKVVDLCDAGDSFVTEHVAKEFKGKDIEKGISVPTCISVNHCAAHTVVVQSGDAPITGRAADVMQATSMCYEAAARLIKPGKKVADVAPVLAKIAEAYGCNHIEGVMSNQMSRFIIDAGKVVLNRPQPDQRVEDEEFEEGEVYSIDMIVSTGDGKPKMADEKETTVFKRALETQYQLKIKASRELFAEINKKYPTMLFSLRGIDVTYEKEDLVAQVKGTFLLMPNGSDRLNQFPQQTVQSDKSVDDEEIKALLSTSLKKKKGKKAKKAAAAAAASS